MKTKNDLLVSNPRENQMTDREFVEWCRANQFDSYDSKEGKAGWDRLRALAQPCTPCGYAWEIYCDLATLRLDLAEARERLASVKAV